jgi:hypothetical protein
MQKKPDSEVHKISLIQETNIKVIKILYQSRVSNHEKKTLPGGDIDA